MPLRELFDEVATHGEPASRLTADDVYDAATRQRRLAMATRMATAMVAAVGLAGVVLSVVGPAGLTDRFGGGTGVRVWWAGASDPDHLYAAVTRCDECPPEAVGSDDGGRTWTVRRPVTAAGVIGTVGAPRYVVAGGGLASPLMTDGRYFAVVSSDGGRTWSKLVKSDTRVESAPPAALIRCAGFDTARPTTAPLVTPASCTVDVIDLAGHRFAPLATQPDLDVESAWRAQDGGVWAAGRHRDDQVPAVASSVDGGRTWSVDTFPDLPDLHPDRYVVDTAVDTRDGKAVYAEVRVARRDPPETESTVYRFRRVDGGAWQRLDQPEPRRSVGTATSYVTPDGTHVVGEYHDERILWWACRPGSDGYEQIGHPAGLVDGPAIEPRPDGGFVTHDDAALYLSADGWTWRRIEIRT
jgi:hypothetical protein